MRTVPIGRAASNRSNRHAGRSKTYGLSMPNRLRLDSSLSRRPVSGNFTLRQPILHRAVLSGGPRGGTIASGPRTTGAVVSGRTSMDLARIELSPRGAVSSIRALVGSSLGVAAASGILLVSGPRPSRVFLAALAVHFVSGLLLVALAPCLLWRRQARSLPEASAFPWIRSLVLLAAASGVLLVAPGRSFHGGLSLGLHVASAAALGLSVAPHALRLLRSSHHRDALRAVFAVALVVGTLGFASLERRSPAGGAEAYSYPFGENPFYPSNVRTRDGHFLEPWQFPPASQCARCHPGVHRQWLESAHRNSFREPFYKKNVDLLIQERGIEVTRHCEGCHKSAVARKIDPCKWWRPFSAYDQWQTSADDLVVKWPRPRDRPPRPVPLRSGPARLRTGHGDRSR